MEERARTFVIGLRQRFARFETGARKREHEQRAAFERRRGEHRAARNIVAPPFSSAEVVRRNQAARAPVAPGVPDAPGRTAYNGITYKTRPERGR